MYGSNFQIEQAMNTKRFSTMKLQGSINRPKSEMNKSYLMVTLISLMLIISTACLAGSSQPKIAGRNGNANGR